MKAIIKFADNTRYVWNRIEYKKFFSIADSYFKARLCLDTDAKNIPGEDSTLTPEGRYYSIVFRALDNNQNFVDVFYVIDAKIPIDRWIIPLVDKRKFNFATVTYFDEKYKYRYCVKLSDNNTCNYFYFDLFDRRLLLSLSKYPEFVKIFKNSILAWSNIELTDINKERVDIAKSWYEHFKDDNEVLKAFE